MTPKRGMPAEPALIYRAFDVPSVLESIGGGGSPRELRSDAGVFYQYDLASVIGRTQGQERFEVSTVFTTVGAGNTTVSGFHEVIGPVEGFEEDGYLVGFNAWVESNPANLETMIVGLEYAPISTDPIILFMATQADVTALATPLASPSAIAIEGFFQNMGRPERLALPVYVTDDARWWILLRTNAGGACVVRTQWAAVRSAHRNVQITK